MPIEVRQNLVPTSKYIIKCPYTMTPEYITFHNTANDASADSEIKYMISNPYSTSYHYAVDDKEVVQGIPLNRNAWHCGDGTGTGNRKSIGVEVCYSKSGGERYIKAEKLAIKFIAQLLQHYGWGIERVKPHKSWSGKNCPHRILDTGRWQEVLNAIEGELKGEEVVSVPKSEVKSEVSTKPSSQPKELGLVDWMNSKGMDSSYSNRAKLAKEYRISNYSGESDQNIKLLDLLQKSKSAQESKPTPTSSSKPKADMKTNSIVEYLQSIGVNSSFSNRKKLAAKYGVKGYNGEASENLRLLELMRDGGKTVSKSESKPAAKKSSGIKSMGKIRIVNVSNAAIIMDKPDRDSSKNVGTIGKGETISIAGSVKGKNNPDGYWEVVIDNGTKRAYISGQFGKLI